MLSSEGDKRCPGLVAENAGPISVYPGYDLQNWDYRSSPLLGLLKKTTWEVLPSWLNACCAVNQLTLI